MIVDGHAHAFPYLGGASGFPSAEYHTRLLQRHFTTHPQGGRRVSDNEIAPEAALWDGTTPGFEGLLDVGFHVGEFGRFEWERDGVAISEQLRRAVQAWLETRGVKVKAERKRPGSRKRS